MAEKVANHMTLTFPSDREIAVTRTFDAPRSLVFEAFVRCEHLSNWWGPRGFTLVECEIDLRPGGAYRFVQTAPDGGVHPFKGVWREINPPERLVFTQIYDVEPYSIHESVVTNVLTEQDGRTALTQHLQFSSKEARDWMVASGMEWGMTQSLERLDELLVELRGDAGSEAGAAVELVITREFDAPRDLVWKAWTEPDRLAKWWGPAGFAMKVTSVDVRPGGLFLYGMRPPDREDQWGRFVFREVVPQERIVFVNSFSDEKAA